MEKIQQFRIWHIPNPPSDVLSSEAFCQTVRDPSEGRRFLDLIADYDLFLGEEIIGSNCSGIEVLDVDAKEWVDYDEEY